MDDFSELRIRVHDGNSQTTLVYLPGLHGDWTLLSPFRQALAGRVRLVETAYPRTLTWSLADHARALWRALEEAGLSKVWLLGESFGSQVMWAMWAEAEARTRVEGLILAGGFVRYPLMSGVRLIQGLNRRVPHCWLGGLCGLYARYAKWRHGGSAEHLAGVCEFLRRRSEEADRQAIVHRYDLIATSDFRPLAQQTRRPVYCLAGLLDPVVPWPLVWPWLKRRCPGFRAGRLLWRGDHNVLTSAGPQAAERVCGWIGAEANQALSSPRPERTVS